MVEAVAALDAEAGAWLQSAMDDVHANPGRLRLSFARAARRTRATAVSGWAAPLGLASHFTPLHVARLSLMLQALGRLPREQGTAAIVELFRRAELGEQQSILASLPYLPDPERFVELAAEASRTNAVSVFSALACNNPFPARYMPELNFNQLVLKALFLEVPLEAIENLAERVTGELLRMVRDYGSERRAAGRSVPVDIDRIESMMKEPTP